MDHEIEETLCRSYTVRHLIEALEDMDPDARVLITCNYGDYHRTQQALPIEGIEEHETDVLHESGYSQSGLAFSDPNAEPDDGCQIDDEPRVIDPDELMPVVIITCG